MCQFFALLYRAFCLPLEVVYQFNSFTHHVESTRCATLRTRQALEAKWAMNPRIISITASISLFPQITLKLCAARQMILGSHVLYPSCQKLPELQVLLDVSKDPFDRLFPSVFGMPLYPRLIAFSPSFSVVLPRSHHQ